MESSILKSIKIRLGIEDLDAFDEDIIALINTSFMALNQIGIGPEGGYSITGVSEEWSSYIKEGEHNLEAVKTYIYLKVKLAFDPPSSSFILQSMSDSLKEIEWRLCLEGDSVESGE